MTTPGGDPELNKPPLLDVGKFLVHVGCPLTKDCVKVTTKKGKEIEVSEFFAYCADGKCRTILTWNQKAKMLALALR
jgi:hypothetical protein